MLSQEVQKNTKEKLPKIIKVKNENEAKQLVRNLKRDGYNGKAILKTKIMIDGEKFPLNVSKIEEICKLKQNSKGKTEFTDADFFKLFQQGLTPNDVVPRLKCTFDEADKAFEKFQKYSGMTLTSLEELDTLYSHLYTIDPFVDSLDHATKVVKTAVESHIMLQQYWYYCPWCRKKRVFGVEELHMVLKHVKDTGYCCDECVEPLYG